MNQTPASSTPARTGRSRFIFWIAALLFLGPFITAFVIYRWFPHMLPEDRTNYGKLVDPPHPLPEFTFVDAQGKALATQDLRNRWNLVYIGEATCEAACRERLHFARQLWLSLNEKRVKLKRVYVAPDADSLGATHAALGEEHVDQEWLGGTGTTGYGIRRFFEFANPNSLYVVDPFGNWVMTYVPTPGGEEAVQQDFKGMQKDLKKLLKL
jgi:cytochrome oxidase Cu insertion factor (SCO1/SenC/PrrC family)